MASSCGCVDSACTRTHGFQCGAVATYLMRRANNGTRVLMCAECADYAYHSGQYVIEEEGVITNEERRRRAKDDGVSYE